MTLNLIIIEPEKSFNLSEEFLKTTVKSDEYDTINDLIENYSIELKTKVDSLIVIHKGNIIDNSKKIDKDLIDSTLVIFKLPNSKKKKLSKLPNIFENLQSINNTSTLSNPMLEAAQSLLMSFINNSTNSNFMSNISNSTLTDLENSDLSEEEDELENNEPIPAPPGLINNINDSNSITSSINALFNSMTQNTNLYKEQSEKLEAMGFLDKQKNMEALMVTEGNVDMAVNYILQNI